MTKANFIYLRLTREDTINMNRIYKAFLLLFLIANVKSFGQTPGYVPILENDSTLKVLNKTELTSKYNKFAMGLHSGATSFTI